MKAKFDRCHASFSIDQAMAPRLGAGPNWSGLRPDAFRGSYAVMSTKSREVIWGGRIMGAKIRAQGARERAQEAIREASMTTIIRRCRMLQAALTALLPAVSRCALAPIPPIVSPHGPVSTKG
jgi:hypothetical protein